MLIPVHQPLDLATTLESGQAFRWRRHDDWYYGVVFDSFVKLRQVRSGVEFFCAPQDEASMVPRLHGYLGLGEDLERIYREIAADQRMQNAIERYKGLRVLHQEPWECLICFICSAYSNIRRISGNVEDLATAFGHPLALDGQVRSTFPTAQELAEASEQRLRQMGLGYRAKYIPATARMIADGAVDLSKLREAPYEEALQALTQLPGVGDKVANCVLLFSLDKTEAFPVDVWVHRALNEWYLDGLGKQLSRPKMRMWAREYFGPYAGYANQYLFQDRRLEGARGSTSG